MQGNKKLQETTIEEKEEDNSSFLTSIKQNYFKIVVTKQIELLLKRWDIWKLI